LPGEDLDAILQIHPCDVEAKRVAGEEGDIFEEVTPWSSSVPRYSRLKEILTIQDSRDPMENGGPEVDPPNKVKIVWWTVFSLEYIIDGFVKNSDRS
jgi:hypothetical protein